MEPVALYDAKNRLSELCNRVVETGEACVISRRGRPIVKLVPFEEPGRAGSVWGTVEESQARYGPLGEDFDLPPRVREVRPDPLDGP
jgi:prevent-host-death family protein